MLRRQVILRLALPLIVVLMALVIARVPAAFTDPPIVVATQHNDNNRSGANLNETILDTSNVNVNTFGKIFSRTVVGGMYAQPLYVPDVMISGTLHNVVYVATMRNNVYAFDADDPEDHAPLWQVNLGIPARSDDFGWACGTYRDITDTVGILGTPVIDLSTNMLYAVAVNKPAPDAERWTAYHTLHTLDMRTGLEKPGSPITITAVISGTSSGSDLDGNIVFHAYFQNQRPGLLLSKGKIYMAFASYCDTGSYNGWVMAYDAATLQQAAVWNSTPWGNGAVGAGGIWQSGQGLSADANGSIYSITGNGLFSTTVGHENYGSSVVKLSEFLTVTDHFTPYDYQYLNDNDLDLGSSGVLLIPNTNLLLGGGKTGVLYLMNRDNLGGFTPGGPDQVVQSFKIDSAYNYVLNNNIHGSPVYWNSAIGQRLYVWTESDRLKVFSFNGSTINPTPIMSGTVVLPDYYMPGGILSLSANGNDISTGLLWASYPTGEDANPNVVSGTLRAYNASATGLVSDLWNSDQNFERDQVGYFPKFAAPTIADGKAYLGNLYQPATPNILPHLVVYGLLSPRIVRQPISQTINAGQSATLTAIATGRGPLNYQWYAGSPGDTSHPATEATSKIFVTPALTQTTSYWVQVTNSVTTTANTVNSLAAIVTVLRPPIIIEPPQSQSINSGQSVTLTVVATGAVQLNYQWYQGSSGDTSTPVGTNSALFHSPSLVSVTVYWVRVTNLLGSIDSATAVITLNQPPSITTPPISQTINSGQSVTLTVSATGTLPLNYQWYEGNAGDTSQPVGVNSPTFTSPILTRTTRYWVRVSNVVTNVDSEAAIITVRYRTFLPVVRR